MMARTAGAWVAGILAAGLVAAPALAEPPARWLHVRVQDRGGQEESVRINLPVSILQTLADSIEDEHFKAGTIRLADDSIKGDQLRAMWAAIRDAKDMEFVTVESDDDSVRVAKSGRYLLAKVRDRGEGAKGEKVEVRLPLEVVDALLKAPEGQLNVRAALEVLARYEGEDLVLVHDEDSDVHIWIDSKSEAD